MIKITGEELPNIPWQEKPEGCHDVVWRYSGNPIIERDAIPSSNSNFNSAVVPFEGADEEILKREYRYDPRVCFVEDRYYITWCNGYVYSFGAALLDLEKPWIVKYRTKPYLLSPQKLYECVGDVPNVTFPCAALADAKTGKIAIYYGCADTVTGLAFAKADELISYIKENSL